MALGRAERRLLCPRGHSFDVARSGYINLLQPQERRSKHPGDTAAAVAARRRLHDRGATEPLLRAIAEMIAARPGDIVLDAGCGDGFYLGALARQTGFDAHGVDISIPAVDAAARRYPECEWIVTNADRFLPYADRSFSIVLSITARMNAGEFRRVLRDGGVITLASGPKGQSLLRLDPQTLTSKPLAPVGGQFRMLTASSDSRFVYAMATAFKVVRLAVEDGKEVKSWSLKAPARTLAVSEDGKRAYIGLYHQPPEFKGKVVVLSFADGVITEKATLSGPVAIAEAVSRRKKE
jgi:SAM-dependent methyltransferase